jgi:hypothetical protein
MVPILEVYEMQLKTTMKQHIIIMQSLTDTNEDQTKKNHAIHRYAYLTYKRKRKL